MGLVGGVIITGERLEKWAALKGRGGKRGDREHETDKLRKEKEGKSKKL